MTLTIADISTELLMDTTTALQEIECRMNARAFTAVHYPEQGPAVRHKGWTCSWRYCAPCEGDKESIEPLSRPSVRVLPAAG